MLSSAEVVKLLKDEKAYEDTLQSHNWLYHLSKDTDIKLAGKKERSIIVYLAGISKPHADLYRKYFIAQHIDNGREQINT